jgi:predicted phosphodiesterase
MAIKLVIPKEATLKNLPTPPELIVPWSGAPPRSMIIDSDNHFPHHHKRFQSAKLKFAEGLGGIDHWLNVGDHSDFTGLSTFLKDPTTNFSLQDEFDSSLHYWNRVCNYAKRVDYIQGNHEFRLEKTIFANTAFFGLRALKDWNSLAGIPPKVKVHPYGSHVQVGLVWGCHGDHIKGSNPVASALATMGGRMIAFGHTHKLRGEVKTLRDENGKIVTREVWNTGYGQDPKTTPWAGAVPNWQLGFLFVEHFKSSNGWDLNVHPIRANADGSFMFRGRVYSG